jgi:hypothetical protein
LFCTQEGFCKNEAGTGRVRYSYSFMNPRAGGRVLKFGLLLAVGAGAGTAIPAHACSCVDACKPESACIRESFKYAAAVFVATPVEVVVQPREFKLANLNYHTINYHVQFTVKESFKGLTTSYAVSDNGSGGGDCSYGKMDVGRDYLIYAGSVSKDSAVDIHACSRTEPLDAGLGTKPSTDSDWSEATKKSMMAGQKALRKELALLRKLRNRAAHSSH